MIYRPESAKLTMEDNLRRNAFLERVDFMISVRKWMDGKKLQLIVLYEYALNQVGQKSDSDEPGEIKQEAEIRW